VLVRPARDDDAEAAARLIRRSIRELCTADHHCDPVVLRPWLANKRPEIFREWLAGPQNIILAAEDAPGRLLGVAGATAQGEITLNYVDPDARYRGASTALIAELERRLAALGLAEVRLLSTRTAHRFYLARGYRDSGPPEPSFGSMLALPMIKELSAGSVGGC
jgi:GNAT superfamily N-acetyltransferase